MLIILNNKCHFSSNEFKNYLKQLNNIKQAHNLIICPTFLYLNQVDSPNLILGSQDVSCYETGAYTGEVAASQLKSLNVKYTIVGHSERRLYFNETDFQIKQKLTNLLAQDIIPILCVGERQNQDQVEIISKQLEVLKDLEYASKVIIAYEPIWAIGSGKTPTIEQIEETVKFIKTNFPENKVIYGGSINENNINNLKSKLIDGYLLGGLSIKPQNLELFLKELNNEKE